MKVEDSGLLQNVEVSQNSGLSVIAYQALNIFQRIFLQYAIDIATIYTILKALIYSRYIRFTKIQCTLEIPKISSKITLTQYLV